MPCNPTAPAPCPCFSPAPAQRSRCHHQPPPLSALPPFVDNLACAAVNSAGCDICTSMCSTSHTCTVRASSRHKEQSPGLQTGLSAASPLSILVVTSKPRLESPGWQQGRPCMIQHLPLAVADCCCDGLYILGRNFGKNKMGTQAKFKHKHGVGRQRRRKAAGPPRAGAPSPCAAACRQRVAMLPAARALLRELGSQGDGQPAPI